VAVAQVVTGHQRPYRYIGPADVLAAASRENGGRRIDSAGDLAEWLATLSPAEHAEPHTFVVDLAGGLRLAPSSEHVACSGGRPVLSAGEITFARQDIWTVTEVSNQLTGYCPRAVLVAGRGRRVREGGPAASRRIYHGIRVPPLLGLRPAHHRQGRRLHLRRVRPGTADGMECLPLTWHSA
jgi:hypothetical protein